MISKTAGLLGRRVRNGLLARFDGLDAEAGCNEPTFPVVNEKANRAFAHSNSPDLECA
jgi:hypothetical protein